MQALRTIIALGTLFGPGLTGAAWAQASPEFLKHWHAALDSYDTGPHAGDIIVALFVIGISSAIYFLPTTIASNRKIAMGAGTMFCLNLLIGLTGIGLLFLIMLSECAKTTA
jgi:hypothetical protein